MRSRTRAGPSQGTHERAAADAWRRLFRRPSKAPAAYSAICGLGPQGADEHLVALCKLGLAEGDGEIPFVPPLL